MKKWKRPAIMLGAAAAFIIMCTCVCFAATVGTVTVYNNNSDTVVATRTFESGQELARLVNSTYDNSRYDIYIELSADLDLGGSSGDPLLFESDADIWFNLKGHTVKRSFSNKNEYYDDGNVMEISPGRDDAQVWIFSHTDRSMAELTAEKGIITGGQNEDEGGGIYFDDGGRVHFSNVKITGNKTEEEGGGIYTNDTDLIVYLDEKAEITYNESLDYGGGACLYWGRLVMNEDSEITHNTAHGRGGGICVLGGFYDAELEINGGKVNENNVSNIDGNSKVYGGGIYCAGDIKINSGEVCGNNAWNNNEYRYLNENVCGGGIYLDYSDIDYINDTKINDNRAYGSGGGIYFDYGTELTLKNSEVCNNIATRGGGLFLDDRTDIQNTLINNNTAHSGNGGGIFLRHVLKFSDCTISGNTAPKGGGGGIYAVRGVEPTRCNITNNTASYAAGVFVDSQYNFSPKEWCVVSHNFNNDKAYSNVFLGQGNITTAYLRLGEITNWNKTLIYVTTADDDNPRRIANATTLNETDKAQIEKHVWYDDSNWRIKVDDSRRIVAVRTTEKYCIVHFMEEVTVDTIGNTESHEIGSYVYPTEMPILKGTVWGMDIDKGSYDTVYEDRPLHPGETSSTAVRITSAGGNPINNLYFKVIHGETGGNAHRTDNLVTFDDDWVITSDVYYYIRNRNNVTSVVVDIPPVVPGEPLPEKAHVIEINGVDVSNHSDKPEMDIVWSNATAVAEPGRTYEGVAKLNFTYKNADVGGYHYYNAYDVVNLTGYAVQEGKKIEGSSPLSRFSTFSMSFGVNTSPLVFESIEWPDTLTDNISTQTGKNPPEQSLPDKVPVKCSYKVGDTTKYKTILAGAGVSYTAEQSAARAGVVFDNTDPDTFLSKAGEYGFNYTVTLPEGVEVPEGAVLSRTSNVSVTGDEIAIIFPGNDPSVSFTPYDADPSTGTLKYTVGYMDPGYETYVRHYPVGTEDASKPDYDKATTDFRTITIPDSAKTFADSTHMPYRQVYCIEAHLLEINPTGGYQAPIAQNCWYMEVVYQPKTYTLTVDGKVDTEKFPGSTWEPDEVTSYLCDGETTRIAPPKKTGETVANHKFLRWELVDGVITEANRTDNPLSITMPESDLDITAVFAPLVTGVSFSLTDDTTVTKVQATLTDADGGTHNADANVFWETGDSGNDIAIVTIAEQPDNELYFSTDVQVEINSEDAESAVVYDDNMAGTLLTGLEFVPVKPDGKTDPSYSAPEPRNLTYIEGTPQRLVSGGSSFDGVMLYALGTQTEPTADFTDEIPEAEAVGTYYVWYYVEGDEFHNDTEPAVVRAEIAKAPDDEDEDTDDEDDDDDDEGGGSWIRTFLLNFFAWGFFGRILQWLRMLHIF